MADDGPKVDETAEDVEVRALQVLVIVMGLMIVAGVAVIITTIATRSTQRPDQPKGSPAFGDVQLSIPAGGRVVWATVDGGRLVVHIQGTAEAARFEVIDLTTGARLGAVQVASEVMR